MAIDKCDLRERFLRSIPHKSVIIFAFAFSFNNILAFNLDLNNFMEYRSPTKNESYFGYTVAQYINNSGQPTILVGAPISEDESVSSTYKGGAVYVCDMNNSVKCDKLNFPRSKEDLRYGQNQWLGATLTTDGSNGGVVMTCAPRYCRIKYDFSESEPVGNCYYTKNGSLNFTPYSPYKLSDKRQTIKDFGSGQVGFSAAISKDSEILYVGAVGTFYWQGQVWAEKIQNSHKSKTPKDGIIHDTYLGYSMTSLDFRGNVPGLAVSQPRGLDRNRNMTGQVNFFSRNYVYNEHDLLTIKAIMGEQFGAYFGYSTCVSDVDGDGAKDLIVGAPLHYENSMYETGRIYVYYQGNFECLKLDASCGEKIFNKSISINGTKSGARFGHAVTSLGDINQDGFEDIAVSAPYEADVNNQSGAVYIYLGSKNGLNQRPSQIIRPSDIIPSRKNKLKTFGFSLFGGLDLDGNEYPDLAVGAYESEVVYLFKSRPVIHLQVNFSYLPEDKKLGKIIDLDKLNFIDETNNKTALLVKLEICLQYHGRKVEKKIDISANITLDTNKPQSPRMHFFNPSGPHRFEERFTLVIDRKNCTTLDVLVDHSNPKMDKLTSLDAQLEYGLVKSKNKKKLPEMLNFGPRILTDSLQILKNCGDDKICVPDLNLTVVSNLQKIVMNSKEESVQLELAVSVQNDGEDSFESKFALNLSRGLEYSHTDQPVFCEQILNNTRNIICQIGNPLRAKQKINFIVYFSSGPDMKNYDSVSLWASVNSTNAENKNTLKNNQRLLEIPVINVNIRSDYPFLSPFDILKFTFANDTDAHAGPTVKHRYLIENLNPTTIKEVTALFYWPFKLSTGEDLLYLVQQPKTYGNIKCDVDKKYVNHRNLTLTRDYEKNENSGDNRKSLRVSNSAPPTLTDRKEIKSSRKRSVLEKSPEGSNNITCYDGTCFLHIRCEIRNISKDEEISVMFPSLLWAETIQRIARGKTKPVVITSYGKLDIGELGNSSRQSTNTTFSDQVSIMIEIPKTVKPDVIPLRIVVESSSLGTLILMIMIYGLYRWGFFERKHPPPAMSGTYAQSIDDLALANDVDSE